jgi:hypothetical protein
VSVTLYREGLPRIELNGAQFAGREGMLVGFVDSNDAIAAIVMTEDGQLSLASLSDFRIQFHYEVETDEWVDENTPPTPETDRE